ncbi:MAG: DUF4910 domain-containing protein [Pseudomonadota bacterium]
MQATGQELHDFAARLYPICRSISGNGVRQTLRLIGARIPLQLTEVPSGTRVFDWEVPLEWNVEDASVTDPDGKRVVDFQAHNLHLVSYSEPLQQSLSLDELAPRLHSLAARPDWIPYRTSYYKRNWGFCMRHAQREKLRSGKYQVEINTSLSRGSLTYGETVLPGRSRDEVLFVAHTCHPSLANDNTSSMSVATALAEWIASEPRRLTYRFVFAPATIGALCWLHGHRHGLGRIRHGLVLALLGDSASLTYKRSRRDDAPIDAIAGYVAGSMDAGASMLPFSPYGYDERQLCSPGFNLPVGRLTRSVNGGFPEYHTSADDPSLIRPEKLQHSFETLQQIVRVIEGDATYVNQNPHGEPMLGKRGLYSSTGGRISLADRENAMLWILNQSDGGHSLLDIAQRSGLDFNGIRAAASELEGAGLLKEKGLKKSKKTVVAKSPRASTRPVRARKTTKKRGE